MTGKKSIVPSGTEHVRIAVPPPPAAPAPTRNQIAPRCPTMQLAPVVSDVGFGALGTSGIDAVHCHHSAVRVGNGTVGEPPESAIAIWEMTSGMAAAIVPNRILCVAFSLEQ